MKFLFVSTIIYLPCQVHPLAALKECSHLCRQAVAIYIYAMEMTLELTALAFASMAALLPCVAVDSTHRMLKITVRINMDPLPVSNAMCSLMELTLIML